MTVRLNVEKTMAELRRTGMPLQNVAAILALDEILDLQARVAELEEGNRQYAALIEESHVTVNIPRAGHEHCRRAHCDKCGAWWDDEHQQHICGLRRTLAELGG